ncbi:SDR family NAD(P)-dependent oxidoreductase [Ilumatobacter sp.]|uniref:SDR family NAD(P)-dependent oxidoreductase n=1 Tax=Ilumatobacter sp. TaxID=1967498 RepID=UPI003AF441EE
MPDFSDIVDTAIEVPVVPSFTKIGYAVRSRLDDWTDLDSYDLTGRTYLVTGSTSGLGRAAARQLAAGGAHVVLNGRGHDKTDRVREEIVAETGSTEVSIAVADMGELDQVRAMATDLTGRFDRIDGLLHNAGALSAERRENSQGIEATVASQVVGPFLLTSLLLDSVGAAAPGRIITMSSGGMYSAGLTVNRLQMNDAEYGGSEQYARAKRAQVTLNEMWAERVPADEIVFQALHPGWADTPGVEEALPTFRKVIGPLLRDTDQGADTMVWLAADDGEPLRASGGFWLDRRTRSIHKLGTTRRTDAPERRAELWDWCVERSGAALEPW